jgi:Putative Ig domain
VNNHVLRQILETLTKMEATMATRQDLDAAESNLAQAITTLATDFNKAITDLIAAINSGSGDLTSEVEALTAINTQVQALDAKANSSDPANAPVISSPTSATVSVGGKFSYQIVASNNPTSFDAVGLPSALTVDTVKGLISGTVAAVGVSSVVVKAINASGTGVATLTITAA